MFFLIRFIEHAPLLKAVPHAVIQTMYIFPDRLLVTVVEHSVVMFQSLLILQTP
jgi:hypothetical protein